MSTAATRDGGPAFPQDMSHDPCAWEMAVGGLSIRDWFASSPAAVRYAEGEMENRTVGEMNAILGDGHTQAQLWRHLLYEFADAMLAERGAAQPEPVNEQLLSALEALGVMPEGHCFCPLDRNPLKLEHQHSGECRVARAAIATARTHPVSKGVEQAEDVPGLSDFDRANVGRIVSGRGDWFSADLLRLIARSDAANRARLHQLYPQHVEAFEAWQQQGGQG